MNRSRWSLYIRDKHTQTLNCPIPGNISACQAQRRGSEGIGGMHLLRESVRISSNGFCLLQTPFNLSPWVGDPRSCEATVTSAKLSAIYHTARLVIQLHFTSPSEESRVDRIPISLFLTGAGV